MPLILVKVKTRLDSEERTDGYLAIDTVAFIRGTGNFSTNAPEVHKFSVQVFYTIYPDDKKESIIYRGGHTLPWEEGIDTSNAFSYAYDKLKEIDTFADIRDA